jgi:integrase
MNILSRKAILKISQAARITRDRILIRFWYETGCTPGEATRIRVKDINVAMSTIYISRHGRTPARVSYISTELVREIADYTARSRPQDYIFSMTLDPLSPKRIAQIVEELSVNALRMKITPLQIRYAHIAHALEFGLPLSEIQKQVGLDATRAMQLYEKFTPKHL